jgi:hypothetical protein
MIAKKPEMKCLYETTEPWPVFRQRLMRRQVCGCAKCVAARSPK